MNIWLIKFFKNITIPLAKNGITQYTSIVIIQYLKNGMNRRNER